MKPVFQSTFGAPNGDCFSAALASILEISLAYVPRFCDSGEDDWGPIVNNWLRYRGMYYVEFKWNDYFREVTPRAAVYVLSGGSPRGGDIGHSVVGFEGRVLHDPHPSGAGIVPHAEHPWDVGLLVPFDPTKVRT